MKPPIPQHLPEIYYEIIARDLGEDKARWARLPYEERMKELEWYHANFNTPDELAELDRRLGPDTEKED